MGAKPVSRESCISTADILMSSSPVSDDEISSMKDQSIFLGLMEPFANRSQFSAFQQNNVSAISMEFIPRITRAQKMDVLSSQSNLAGYVSVIESAKVLKSALPMMMTAAGTLKPATVFVIGVGVAGLQAIATARRLGAKVEAFDTRPVVEEQVKSLGAKFVKLDLGNTGQTDQGYANELSKEQIKLQKELQSEVCARSDIVITTAQLFGKPAPKLVDENTIKKMKPGSVIFDMAVESGGNVEGSVLDEITNIHGVKVIGFSNLPSLVADHASFALSNNFMNFITDFYDKEDKLMKLDLDDEVIKSALLVHDGQVLNGAFK
jgi:NAD(P) transhydrogenase subunit alpha